MDSNNILGCRQLCAAEIRAFYASRSARAILPVSPEVVQAVFVEVHRAETEDFDKIGEPSVVHGASHLRIGRLRSVEIKVSGWHQDGFVTRVGEKMANFRV